MLTQVIHSLFLQILNHIQVCVSCINITQSPSLKSRQECELKNCFKEQ